MKKKYTLLFVLFFALSFSFKSYASHLLGADLAYECIGPNQYRVTLNVYRDCKGISAESSHVLNYFSPTCNVSSSITLNKQGPGVDITPFCPGTPSSCNGGSGSYGIEKNVYVGILTLPAGCLANDWIISWETCCRNAAITTLSGASNNNMYVQANINDLNAVVPCNSSPVFNNLPGSIVCVNKPVNYNHGAVDPDGDSLVFSLINCFQSTGANVTYNSGFSGTTPLTTSSGVTVNSQTGAITFTPNQIQIGVLCVKVEEFRNGVKIGETMRDIQFNVINCTNDPPTATGINGSSNTTPLNFVTSSCANSQVCFDINIGDVNTNNVTASWNNGIPGASMTFTNQNTPTPTATFCWTPTNNDLGTNFFTITLRDNACPVVGIATYTYTVNVTPSPHTMTISPDASICPGQSTILTATAAGTTGITWAPALGLNTTTGGTVTASPAATQIYTATAAFSDGCDLTKSVTVNVKSLPQVSVNPRNILACTGQNVTLTASSTTSPTPAFSWSTGAGTSSIVVAPAATTTYTVTATSNSCTASASTTITINQPTGQACNVLYASPTGVSTNTGTRTSPYDLATAIQKGGCQGAVIKMAVGTYTLDNPLNMLGELTLEGGFDPANNWIKTSLAGATTINRTANNVEDIAGASPRIVAIYGNGVQNVNFQDLTITTANAPAASAGQYGISTYGVHFTNCANYMFRRCQILPGNGGVGGVGANNTTTALAGAAGGAGTTTGGCDAGECTFSSGWGGGVGGNGGTGATGVAGGAGGAGNINTANPGSVGTAGTGRNGGGGGGGSAGSDECSSNSSAGATGGASTSGAGGGGGTAGSSGDPGGPGGNGSPGVNGTTGATGATGPNGTFAGGYFNPGAAGGQGGFGIGGSGGGGGGGGGRQTCTLCDDAPGNGGGGGGGGGQGGVGGFGGLGGGGSFPLFAVTNGAGAQLIDCNFTSGTGGAGGTGGTGGAGGAGGTGGAGGSVCTAEIGRGGNGGKGGDGGQGGLGGSGAVGTTSKVYVMSGTAPTYLNNGTSTAITVSAVNNPASFGLAAQPEIKVDDISCMGNTTGFYSAAANTWNLGTGASPIAPTTQNPTTIYSTLGRKDIVYNTNNYRGFHNVLIANTLGPNEATDAPLVSGVYRVCQNTKVGFNVTNPGLGYIYHWTIKDATTNSVVTTFDGTQYDTTSYIFNTPGVYQSIVTFETSCCGISNPDTIVLVVDTMPDITALVATPAAICLGNTAQINATATNATLYSWSPITSITSATNGPSVIVQPTATTNYQLLVSNANGRCVDTASVVVTVNSIDLTMTRVDIGCTSNGSATVTVAGIAGNFLYQWSNGTTNGPTASTTNTINNLFQNVYTVTVTNQTTGCVDSASVTVVKGSGAFSSFINTTNNITCAGMNNGSFTFTTSNAMAPVNSTLVKLPANTSATNGSLAPGDYQLTLTDGAGCVSVNLFTITTPDSLKVDSLTSVPIGCQPGAKGSITVNAHGGNGPFIYTWNNSISGIKDSLLSAGTYTVTVTDASNCTVSRSITLIPPILLNANLVADSAKCFGDNSGRIVATPTNGLAPYTFVWSSVPSQTDSICDNVLPGTYTVTVTDASSCVFTSSATILQPTRITYNVVIDSVNCNGGNDGSIVITPSGGTPSYTFSINAAPAVASGSFTSLTANTYSILVADSKGCDTTFSIPVGQPTIVGASATADSVLCNGGNTGAIHVTPRGGVGSYTYSINSGAFGSSSNFTSLVAGTYTIVVRDGNSCDTTFTMAVGEPTKVGASATTDSVLCIGGNTGAIHVTPRGGVGSYTYSINSGAFGASSNFTSLVAGTYTVVVRDGNSCDTTFTISVGEPTKVIPTFVVDSVNCNGGNDGSITVSATGGISPYSYSINGNSLQSSGSFTSLTANTYSILVRDANGCDTTTQITVGQPTKVGASATADSVLCNGGNSGAINVTPRGGVGSYTYSINSGAFGSSSSFTSLVAGTYTIVVRDGNSCDTTFTVIVGEPTKVGASAIADSVLCNGGNTGAIHVTPRGGVGSYTYSINSGAFGSSSNFTSLVAGTYTIVVRDGNSCDTTFTIAVGEPTKVGSSATTDSVLCNGGNTGAIHVTPRGGVGSYTYSINSGAFGSSSNFTSLVAGIYTVVVRDGNSCDTTFTISVGEPTKVIPTFVVDSVNCNGGNDGSITVSATGGIAPYSYSINGNSLQSSGSFASLNAGIYVVLVRDAKGCDTSTLITVSQPTKVGASATADSVLCNGGNTGAIHVTPRGGVGSYTYSINSGAFGSSSNFASLVAGTYTIVVRDGNSCDTSFTVVVYQPTALNATAVIDSVKCNGGNTGKAVIHATGGIAPYQFSLNSGAYQTDSTFSILTAQTYSVTVKDANACLFTFNFTVAQPTPLSVSIASVTQPICFGDSGKIVVTPAGGISPYTFSANSGTAQSSTTFDKLPAGNYTIVVTDNNACTASVSTSINQPAPSTTLSETHTNVSCFGGNNGAIDLTINGTVTPYDITWTGNVKTEDLASLTAGVYHLTVIDGVGCRVRGLDSVIITQPALLVASVDSTKNATCNGVADGCIYVKVVGGTTAYSYLWSNAAATEDVCGLAAGSYTLTVSDAHSCTTTLGPITITQPASLIPSYTTTLVKCPGGHDGKIDLSVAGGTPNYTYVWSNSATTQDISNLQSGTYFVTITDAKGCTKDTFAVLGTIPPMTFNSTVKNVLCYPLSNGFIAAGVSAGTPPYNYFWSNGFGTDLVTDLPTGNYGLTVTDANNCSTTASYVIINDNAFSISAMPEDTIINLGEVVNVTTNPSTNDVASVVWFPTKGLSCADCLNPIATPVVNTTYIVTATSDSGCVAVDTIYIGVSPEYQIYIPNSFSPNSDGKNDVFEIYGDKKLWKTLSVEVFNRWGERVFFSNDINFGWDGIFKGEMQNPQVYVYQISLTFIDGHTPKLFKGSLNLIR